jgi:uncharacterized integral membrane protein
MEFNWVALGVVGVCILILIKLLIKQNKEEEKYLTYLLNYDHKKERESELNDAD